MLVLRLLVQLFASITMRENTTRPSIPFLKALRGSTLLSVITLISIVLLSACGVPGPGGAQGFDPDQPDNGQEPVSLPIPVTIEATPYMMRQGSTSSSDNIIEADNIDCSRVSVVQLNYDFTERRAADLPAFSTADLFDEQDGIDGSPNRKKIGCQIIFTANSFDEVNFDPQIDAVVKVKYPYESNEFLYAPLRKVIGQQSIVVSFGTHLALEKLFEQFSNAEDLDKALPCNSGKVDCENQPIAKARLLSFIAETARLYEYKDDIQATFTAEQALTLLRSKLDLVTHIETAVKEITRSTSPIAQGTIREYDGAFVNAGENSDLLNRLTRDDYYNSSLFMMGFIEDASTSARNKLVTGTSHIESDDGPSPSPLPYLFYKTTYYDFQYDDIFPVIPTEMTSFRFKTSSQSAEVYPRLPENLFAYQSTSGQISGERASNEQQTRGAHISTQGFLLNDRALYQTIVEAPEGGSVVGYDFNPIYYKLYRSNNFEPDTSLNNPDGPEEDPDYGIAPTWLTGTGYGQIEVHDLLTTPNGEKDYTRNGIRETHKYFTWEVHGLRTSEDLRTSDISNNNYDVIEFSIDVDENDSEELVVRAETLTWNASSSTFLERQEAVSPHYMTFELARNDDNSFVNRANGFTRVPSSNTSSTRAYRLYEDDGKTNGLLTLDDAGRSRGPLGHISDNAEHMAFAIDISSNEAAKRGIILASKQRSTSIALTAGTPLDFTLSGNYFYMDDDIHRLASFNESRLSIASPSGGEDCDATLSLQGISIDHTINSNPASEISSPTQLTPTTVTSTSCALNGGQVEIDFPAVNGQTLTLRGFALRDDDNSGRAVKLMNLLWLQDNALGLAFAQKDQDLSATFDN